MSEYFKAIFPIVLTAAIFLTIWAIWPYANHAASTDMTEQQFRKAVVLLLALIAFREK